MSDVAQSVAVTASGVAFEGQGTLKGAVLAAGAGAAATATLRETNGSGRVVLVLAAVQGTTADFGGPAVRFVGDLHVTLAGAGAHLSVMV